MGSLLIAHKPLAGLSQRIAFSVCVIDARDLSQSIQITLLIQTVFLNGGICQTAKELGERQVNTLAFFLIVGSTAQDVTTLLAIHTLHNLPAHYNAHVILTCLNLGDGSIQCYRA